jgi:uncharacterized protein YndB with AHSA1/START domain
MSEQRIEVQRTIPVPASKIFSILSNPDGHVQIDATGMLMSAEGPPVTQVGDTFLVHMDREALNDVPLGQYTVSIRITAFVRDREIAWTIEHPLIDPPMGYVYGYTLEPLESGTLVTTFYDWSDVPPVHRARINFPVIPEASLRATLGILARTALRTNSN